MKKLTTITLLLLITIIFAGCTFIEPYSISYYDPPGFFSAIWHGLIAPYTLIVRWFKDVEMYAYPNSGWLYDFGFLIGIALSWLPVGWLAAIISIILLIFN